MVKVGSHGQNFMLGWVCRVGIRGGDLGHEHQNLSLRETTALNLVRMQLKALQLFIVAHCLDTLLIVSLHSAQKGTY